MDSFLTILIKGKYKNIYRAIHKYILRSKRWYDFFNKLLHFMETREGSRRNK